MRVESSTLISVPFDIILNSNFQIIHISPKLCGTWHRLVKLDRIRVYTTSGSDLLAYSGYCSSYIITVYRAMTTYIEDCYKR